MLKSLVYVLSCVIAVSSTYTCNFNVKIKQTLRNEGFHRNITYEIVFGGDENEDAWLFQDCIVGLDQTLPAGVYTNPDELGDLKRAKKLNAVPKNRINTELPAEQSSPSSVFIMGTVTGDQLSLWLPVHARYHQAGPGGGMARNEIGPPRLLMRCEDTRLRCAGADTTAMPFPCNKSKDCWGTYKEVPYTTLTDTLIWEVPVGDTRHYRAVGGGTVVVVVAGALYLLNAVHQHKRGRR